MGTYAHGGACLLCASLSLFPSQVRWISRHTHGSISALLCVSLMLVFVFSGYRFPPSRCLLLFAAMRWAILRIIIWGHSLDAFCSHTAAGRAWVSLLPLQLFSRHPCDRRPPSWLSAAELEGVRCFMLLPLFRDVCHGTCLLMLGDI